MLPKIWKKFLLAICIIACLFNITAKIVNRVSLEKVISSQKEGVNVKEILNITDETPAINKPETNTISNYNVEDSYVEPEEVEENQPEEVETEVEEDTENEKSNAITQEEFFDRIFKDNAFTSIMGN